MSTSSPTVILTGASGFIGSAVLAELLQRGVPVIVLLRPDSDRWRIAGLTGYITAPFRRFDDPDLAGKLRKYQPMSFIHCAWRGVFGEERNAYYQVSENVPLTIDSVRLAAACGCSQWIGLGSQAEYGNPNRAIDESASTRPTTIYGKAKLAAGIAAMALCEAKGLSGVWHRIFSIYGPGDHPQWFIPFVIREMLNGRVPLLTPCEQSWDYLYVADAARAILSTADGRTTGIFNLGSGNARPLKQIVETIKAEIGATIEPAYGAVPYRPDQVMHLEAKIDKLRAATGWSPRVGLAEGLRETVAWEMKLFESSRAPAQ